MRGIASRGGADQTRPTRVRTSEPYVRITTLRRGLDAFNVHGGLRRNRDDRMVRGVPGMITPHLIKPGPYCRRTRKSSPIRLESIRGRIRMTNAVCIVCQANQKLSTSTLPSLRPYRAPTIIRRSSDNAWRIDSERSTSISMVWAICTRSMSSVESMSDSRACQTE